MLDCHIGHLGRAWHQVVDQRPRDGVALVVVDVFLEQRDPDALRHAAVNLALDDRRVDHRPAVVDDHIALDLDVAGGLVHGHRGGVRRVRVGDAGRVVEVIGL